jgi:glucose/arabinose dehydrogenase
VPQLRRLSVLLLLSLPLALPAGAVSPGGLVQRVPLASGLNSPIGVTNAGDGSGRLFVIEQPGKIRIWNGSQILSTPFLDLSSVVSSCSGGCGERGLLGLAFHPSYATNGLFYVYYTRASNGDIQIARYHVSGDPNVADPASGLVLLTIPHSSQPNHNGGQMAFGADGYLYLGVGDGGGGGDPYENGQNKTTLLAKLLRIDVDHDGFPADSSRNYAIPADNPFASGGGAPEVWAYGLRNPWRFSFDRTTHDLYIGDVGQNLWEEIDFQAAGAAGGRNYGWDCREGANNYNDTSDVVNQPPVYNADCPGRTFTEPILQYDHMSGGCAVIGGFVYRGRPASSLLTGNYLFSDYCTGQISRAVQQGASWTSNPLASLAATSGLTSFGQGETGRLYITYGGGSLEWLAPYTFPDVPPTLWSWPYVEALFENGLTQGCDGTNYCVGNAANRAEMAVFLVRALHGPSFVPPTSTGIFADVPASHWAAPWIEQLYHDGITQGCATSPLRYCPDSSVTRAEMAIFLLRARHGGSYTPPAASGMVFADVPTSQFAADWIERLYAEGVTTGCDTNPLRYCPADPVIRDQMAAFLTRAFNLSLP